MKGEMHQNQATNISKRTSIKAKMVNMNPLHFSAFQRTSSK